MAFDVLTMIDEICVIIFVVEFSLRFLTVAFVPTRSVQPVALVAVVLVISVIIVIAVVRVLIFFT